MAAELQRVAKSVAYVCAQTETQKKWGGGGGGVTVL